MKLFGHKGGRRVLCKEFLTCGAKFDYMYSPECQALNYCKVRKCWWRDGLFHDFSQLMGAIPQTHENRGQNLSKKACSQHAGTEDSHKLSPSLLSKFRFTKEAFSFHSAGRHPRNCGVQKRPPGFLFPRKAHTHNSLSVQYFLTCKRLQRSTSQKAVLGALN